jgi:uncharacterized iron-regulated membrane protein
MKLHVMNRKVHYWLTLVVAIPFLLIVITGMMLQWKKQVPWIQPPDQRAAKGAPTLALPAILEICAAVPEAAIKSWDDVDRVDFRPRKNLLKVTARNHWEVQIDAGSGAVLQTAYRRSDWIEQLHDGSFFHDHVKLWVFFPASLAMLILWLTGIWMFVRPFLRLRSKARAGA